MRVERVVAFVLLLCCSAALARDDAPPPQGGGGDTDGLQWDKDQPKAFPGGAASQFQVNGGVDITKYKDGLILDDPKVVKVYVYTYDAKTGKRADKHMYDTTIDLKDFKT
jgi:hypothetical protein